MVPALNLLSPQEKHALKRTKLLLLIHEVLFFLFIMVTLGSIILFGARLLLEKKFNEISIAEIPGAPKIAVLNRDIRVINEKLSELSALTANFHPWSPSIIELIRHTPKGITWEALNLRTDGHAILRGKATTRDELANFRTMLQTDPTITSIDLPLQYLVPTHNIEFAIEITYTHAALMQLK